MVASLALHWHVKHSTAALAWQKSWLLWNPHHPIPSHPCLVLLACHKLKSSSIRPTGCQLSTLCILVQTYHVEINQHTSKYWPNTAFEARTKKIPTSHSMTRQTSRTSKLNKIQPGHSCAVTCGLEMHNSWFNHTTTKVRRGRPRARRTKHLVTFSSFCITILVLNEFERDYLGTEGVVLGLCGWFILPSLIAEQSATSTQFSTEAH